MQRVRVRTALDNLPPVRLLRRDCGLVSGLQWSVVIGRLDRLLHFGVLDGRCGVLVHFPLVFDFGILDERVVEDASGQACRRREVYLLVCIRCRTTFCRIQVNRLREQMLLEVFIRRVVNWIEVGLGHAVKLKSGRDLGREFDALQAEIGRREELIWRKRALHITTRI